MLTARSARGWFADATNADPVAKWVDDANKRSSLQVNDLILSTRGTVGLCAVVDEDALPANIDQDVARIAVVSKSANSRYLLAYMNSRYGQDWMERNQSGMVQQGLSLAKVRDMPVPLMDKRTQHRIASVAESAKAQLDLSRDLYAQAEDLLLSELGLKDWQPEEPLTYEATSTDAFAAGRLDAEYFQAKYATLEHHLESNGVCRRLHHFAEVTKGKTLPYSTEGVPVIRSGDLSDISDSSCFLKAEPSADMFYLARGDVLISSIGFGSIGKVQVFDRPEPHATVSEVTIIRQSALNPYFLAMFLQSIGGQLQIERYITGATGQLHLYPRNVSQFLVPTADADFQKQCEEAHVQAAEARDESKALLEKAKRAVEIAIEHGEEAAGQYLDGKAFVQSNALPAMAEHHKYFSLDALKRYLASQKLTYMPETVNAYVSRMKRDGEIFSAGRGWYSSLAEAFELDPRPVAKLTANLEERFPLLDFACWSTEQMNPYLHHMLGKFVAFVYVDRDAMASLFDALRELGYQPHLNPTRREAAKSFVIDEKTVVIRPSVAHAPVKGHRARMEKLLVDLHVEREALALLDPDELREAAAAAVSARRIEIAKLIAYARRRKVNWRDIFLNANTFIAPEEAT